MFDADLVPMAKLLAEITYVHKIYANSTKQQEVGKRLERLMRRIERWRDWCEEHGVVADTGD